LRCRGGGVRDLDILLDGTPGNPDGPYHRAFGVADCHAARENNKNAIGQF